MMRQLSTWCKIAVTAAVLTTSSLAVAHHSGASWDLTRRVSLKGTVQTVEFRNPHGKMTISVTSPGGKSVTWQIETSAMNLLMRRGWKPARIKVGETVTVAWHLKKVPGTNDLYLREVKLADGTVFGDPTGNDKQLD